MISLATDRRRDVIYGVVNSVIAALLIGLMLWLRFAELAHLEQDIRREQIAVQELKSQQQAYFEEGLGDQLAQYSDSIQAIEALFFARDEVFTGLMNEDRFEPMVILDMVFFFERLQDLLSRKVLVNRFSLSPTGRVNFLVRTTSYSDAAQQMGALRFGLEPEEQQRVLSADREDGVTPLPHLFMNVLVSSVSRTELSHQQDDLPALLQGREASYDFMVQMDINPEYFAALREREQSSLTDS